MKTPHVIVLSNSYHQLQIVGPFDSKAEAKEWKKKYKHQWRGIDMLVAPLMHKHSIPLSNEAREIERLIA